MAGYPIVRPGPGLSFFSEGRKRQRSSIVRILTYTESIITVYVEIVICRHDDPIPSEDESPSLCSVQPRTTWIMARPGANLHPGIKRGRRRAGEGGYNRRVKGQVGKYMTPTSFGEDSSDREKSVLYNPDKMTVKEKVPLRTHDRYDIT